MVERAAMAETSTWDFDWTPPGYRSIDRADVRAWCYDGAWAGSRGVGRVRWGDCEIERGFAEIKRFFDECRRPVRWYVGPSTTSTRLADALRPRAAAVHQPRLMTGELDRLTFRRNDEVEIREVTALAQVEEMIDAAFPEFSPGGRSVAIAETAGYIAARRRGGIHLGYLDAELVGVANWRGGSDRPIDPLVGSGAKASHRRRGACSAAPPAPRERARQRGGRHRTHATGPA